MIAFEHIEGIGMRAMKILTIVAVLLAGTTAASARIIGEWDCGEIGITLKKHAVHESEIVFYGRLVVWSPTGKPLTGVHLKWVGKDGVILNGKRCETLPYDPKWDEESN